MNKIEGLCRSFLWHGSGASNGPALVSWEQICKPRKNGGLGFVRLHQWNVATLGKYAWWVQMKADHLWVRWVHAVYLKGQSWSDYVPGSGSSWGWRKLFWVRDLLNTVQVGGMVTDDYSTAAVYARLVDQCSRMVWHPWLTTRLFIPKHKFIAWLAVQGRLLTQDRLVRMGIACSNCCFLCGDKDESHYHLFFECEYSRKCVMFLSRWLGVQIPVRATLGWWLRLRTRSLAMKQILGLAIASLLYRLWWARNTARIKSFVPLPRILCNDSRHDILTRVRDYKIAERIEMEGKASLIVVNKWDTIPNKNQETATIYEQDVRRKLRNLHWAPIVYATAITGQSIDKIIVAANIVEKERSRRLSTATLNQSGSRGCSF
ncbi:hypothetical protein RND81_14G170000 [Saponaria officinalis]|uniref:Reverse transcriptase zinc-binding domain-containing protein n=1 Tax=Saponaria officinalis TaxID=3572 RepID=A0AAW1GRQ8_SAPOF